MIVTRKAVPRRTVLRGLGASIALPLLEGMVPALTATAKTAARGPLRLGVVYIPNGVVIDQWTPETTGAGFTFTPILRPLQRHREKLLIVSGLTQNRDGETSKSGAVHGRCSTRFLTGAIPRPLGQEGNDFRADVGVDQIVARTLGQQTQLGSLELALDSSDVGAGTCDGGYSCVYSHTIAWSSPTTPLPMEYNPRLVFERMFGDSGSTDPAVRAARRKANRSLLDSVTEKVTALTRSLGPGDAGKLSEYLDAVRDVERRIELAEAQNDQLLPTFDQPVGVPPTFAEHARLMFDLQTLAYQSDLTRVITFMMGREFSGRTYPEIGAPGAHHALSHEHSDESQRQLAAINTYHASLFAYYLDRLRSTPDGDGSLLDHSIIYYAAGMSTGNHTPENLPVVLAGGGAGTLPTGQHLSYPLDTPLANLHVSVLDMLGVEVERLHDSTGPLDGLASLG